ncbi:hypothetical protein EE612_046483, partial [Oryza sativa]
KIHHRSPSHTNQIHHRINRKKEKKEKKESPPRRCRPRADGRRGRCGAAA